jgi:hypothetical protein
LSKLGIRLLVNWSFWGVEWLWKGFVLKLKHFLNVCLLTWHLVPW